MDLSLPATAVSPLNLALKSTACMQSGSAPMRSINGDAEAPQWPTTDGAQRVWIIVDDEWW